MAIESTVMDIVRILDEKGFGWLAGELMTEIDLGRELDGEGFKSVEGAEEDEERPAARRVPIPPEEQLGVAISILRLRLVEPARALAEAERIAGPFGDSEAVRIRFVGPLGEDDSRYRSDARPGDDHVANKLDDLLRRILIAPRNLEV